HSVVLRSGLQERAGLRPLALLVEVLDALVDEELPVLGARDPQPLERPRRGPLEVDTRLVEAAAVTRTLELVLRGEPPRRAAGLRALSRSLLPLALLLDAPPRRERRLILRLRLPLGHQSRFPFALTMPPRARRAKLVRLAQQIRAERVTASREAAARRTLHRR